MSKVYEIVDIETVKALYPDATAAVRLTEERRVADGSGKSTRFIWNPSWEGAEMIAEPILRYIHSYMMANGQRDDSLPRPWTHSYRGSVGIIVRKLLPPGSPPTGKNLASLVARSLEGLRVGRRVDLHRQRSKHGHTWLLVAWPEGKKLSPGDSTRGAVWTQKDEALYQRRMEKEPVQDVLVHYDLSLVAIPEELTPDSVLKFVTNLRNCYDQLLLRADHLADEKRKLNKTIQVTSVTWIEEKNKLIRERDGFMSQLTDLLRLNDLVIEENEGLKKIVEETTQSKWGAGFREKLRTAMTTSAD